MKSNYFEKRNDAVVKFFKRCGIKEGIPWEMHCGNYKSIEEMLAHRLYGCDLTSYSGIGGRYYQISRKCFSNDRELIYPLEEKQNLFEAHMLGKGNSSFGLVGLMNNSKISAKAEIADNLTYHGIVAYLALADEKDILKYKDSIMKSIENNAKKELDESSSSDMTSIGDKYRELTYLSCAMIDRYYGEKQEEEINKDNELYNLLGDDNEKQYGSDLYKDTRDLYNVSADKACDMIDKMKNILDPNAEDEQAGEELEQ